MKKILIVVAVVVAVLAVTAGAVRGYRVWKQSQDELPAFVDVPPGPRAPTRSFLGLEIGRTTLPEAEVVYRGAGAECQDSSFRALMEAKREATKKRMEEAKARGEDPDGVTGASLVNYRSKKERNPQVRLACENVSPTAFHDREWAPGPPLYWLIIFDSPEHPLRHTSVSRRISPEVAALEWDAALNAMTRRFGAPTKLKDTPDFGPGALRQAKWEFADLHAEVSAFRIGALVRITERVEVPWPVRTK